MQTGTKISALAHAGLITWVVVGGVFFSTDRARMQPAVAEVSLISAAEFAALTAPQAAAPTPAPAPVPPPARPPVAEAPAPEPEPQPEPAPAPQPEPEPAPPPPAPEPEPPAPAAPPPLPQGESELPRPADRVAPEPVPAPPEAVAVAPAPMPAPAPEPAPEAEPAPEPAAPEAATTQIITEATRTDERGGAPERSIRPQARPARPATPPPAQVAQAPTPTPPPQPQPQPPQPQPQPQPQPEPSLEDELLASIADAAAAAVADAARQGLPAPGSPGGGLTGSEVDALRRAVQSCWNVGALSTEALAVTVTVSFSLDRSARPLGDVRMITYSGGSSSAAQQAFDTARRAILRCGADGFPLPPDKYDAWRDVEMTFNPESMRIR